MEKKVLVYIGPSLKNIVQTGTAFTGGYPPKLQEAVKTFPYLAELVVPAENLAQARKALKEPGSSLNQIYSKIRGGMEHV